MKRIVLKIFPALICGMILGCSCSAESPVAESDFYFNVDNIQFFNTRKAGKDTKGDMIYGEIVFTNDNPDRVYLSDAPTVIVLRKDNGEVIANW